MLDELIEILEEPFECRFSPLILKIGFEIIKILID